MIKKIFVDNEPETIFGIRKYLNNQNNQIYEYMYTAGIDDNGIKKVYPTLIQKLPEFIKVSGYPIGVTRFGEVICVEKPEEAYSFFFTGATGYGKCLEENTEIIAINNNSIKIKKMKDLKIGDNVLSMNKSYKLEEDEVINKWNTKRNLLKIKLAPDLEINCSKEHKFLVYRDELKNVEAKDLKIGDFIPINNKLPNYETISKINFEFRVKTSNQWKKEIIGKKLYSETFKLNEDFGFLIGLYLAEGMAHFTNITISVTDKKLKSYLIGILDKLKIEFRDAYKNIYLKNSGTLKRFILENFNSGSAAKDIPDWVFNSPLEFKKGLLRGYFSGDGIFSTKSYDFGFCSKSKELRDKIIILYKIFGIIFRPLKKYGHGKYKKNVYYYAKIEASHLQNFINRIGFVHSQKEERIKSLKKNMQQYYEKIPISRELLRVAKILKLSKRGTKSRKIMGNLREIIKRNSGYGKARLSELLDEIGILKINDKYISELKNILNGDISFFRVKEILKGKKSNCIDIEVKHNNNFLLANGIITHNSILMHRLIDGLYHHWKYNLFDANDYQPETMSWSISQASREFQKRLALTTLERPRPLPVVHLVPSLKGENPNIPKPTRINYKINFHDLMNHIDLFFDEKELGGSKKYFENIIPLLEGCRSLESVGKVIDKYFESQPKRADVKFKIKNLIGSLINRGITNFDKSIISNVAIRKKMIFNEGGRPRKGEVPKNEINRGNIIPMLIECRLIPVLVTSTLLQKVDSFYASYIEFHLKKVMEYQSSKPENSRNILYIKLDELNEILNKRNSEAVLESIRMLVRGGGYKNIGLIGAAQNINEIDENITSNVEYLFVFNSSGQKDLAVIKKKGHLDNVEVDRIKHLKRFEFFASCKEKGNFIVYDIIGNKIYKTKKIWGMVIPPLSHHFERGKTISAYMNSMENLRKVGYCRQLLFESRLFIENLEDSDQTNEVLGLDAKSAIWDKPLEDPKLIKGINLRKVYYKDYERTKPISYDELKELGLMIYFADGIYYLDKAGKWEGYGRPETMQPRDVKLILIDEEKRKARLWGENADEEWFDIK